MYTEYYLSQESVSSERDAGAEGARVEGDAEPVQRCERHAGVAAQPRDTGCWRLLF